MKKYASLFPASCMKALAVVLSVAMLLSLFAACNKKKDPSSSAESSSSSSSTDATDPTDPTPTEPTDPDNPDDSSSEPGTDEPGEDPGYEEEDPPVYPDDGDDDYNSDDGSGNGGGHVVPDEEEDLTLPETIRDVNDYSLLNDDADALRLTVHSSTDTNPNNPNKLRVVFSEAGKDTFRFKDTDYLEYDVMMAGNTLGTGVVDIEAANGSSRLSSGEYAYDMEGLKATTATNLGKLAANQWYHRKIRIPSELVGKSVFRWSLLQSNIIGGETTETYFKNIRVTDGKGGERLKVKETASTLKSSAAEKKCIESYSLKFTTEPNAQLYAQGDFLRFTVTNSELEKDQSSYIAYNFSNAGKGTYKIQKGDTLVYKVRSTQPFYRGTGSVDIRFTDKSWLSDIDSLTDAKGRSVYPSADLSALSGGKWYYRSVKLPDSLVGKTVDYFAFKALNAYSMGEFETHIADVKIINNNATKLLAYGGGEIKKGGLVAARNAYVSVSRNQSSSNVGAPSGNYLHGTLYAQSVTNASTSVRISSESYAIKPGDCLEYDITTFSDTLSNSGFGVDLKLKSGEDIRFSGWKDQNAITGSVGYDITPYTANQWYHRKISIGNSAGETINQWLIGGELATAENIGIDGRYYQFGVDNIRITNNGKVVKTIYADGAPAETTMVRRSNNDFVVVASTPVNPGKPLNTVPSMTLRSEDDPVVSYSVKDFGAKGDGKTDDTNAIQGALFAAEAIGGGTVFVPAGKYVVKGTLYIPSKVSLRGEWQDPTKGGAGKGTILMAYAGRGNESAYSFIGCEEGSGLSHISVWYPEQSAANPLAYPWTIQNYNQNMDIRNITLYNSYKGVKVGPRSSGIFKAENVFVTALKTGFEIDCNFDVPRLINWTITPDIWANSGLSGAPSGGTLTTLRTYAANNLEAIRSGRVDWLTVYGLKVDYAKIGVRFESAKTIEPNTITTSGSFSNMAQVTLTNVGTGFEFGELSTIGFSLSGGLIQANQGSNPVAIHTNKEFQSSVAFDDVTMSSTDQVVRQEGNGLLNLQNCTINGWNTAKAAIDGKSGSLMVNGCSFAKNGKNMNVAAGVKGFTANGNAFTGSPNVSVASGVPNAVDHAAADFTKTGDSNKHTFRAEPKAGTSKVFDVTAYGAKADGKTDDTAAIQKAIDAAANAGGGIVYFPAGHYCVRGNLNVKNKVELRGVQAGQHHSKTAASILELYAGRGQANGTAAITLQSNAGVKGLDFFYPDQYSWNIVPYSWTIQSRGEGNYVINSTFVNSYQGLDFGTYNGDKHYISSVGGAFVKTGIFLGNTPTYGTMQHTQLIMHYWTSYIAYGCTPENTSNTFETLVYKQQAKQLVAYRFGDVKNESMLQCFTWLANIGNQFVDQGKGGFDGKMVVCGVDGNFINLDVQQVTRLDVVAPFLYVHGLTGYSDLRSYLHAQKTNTGTIRLIGVCAGNASFPNDGVLVEGGEVILQQVNYAGSAQRNNVKVTGGKARIYGMSTWPCTTAYVGGDPTDLTLTKGAKADVVGWFTINRPKDKPTFQLSDASGGGYKGRSILDIRQ